MDSAVHFPATSLMTVITRSDAKRWSRDEVSILEDSELNIFAIAISLSGEVVYLPGEIARDQIIDLVRHEDFTLEVKEAGRPLLMS